MQTAVRDFSDALMASIARALEIFLAAIPRVIGFLVIIIIGWIIASLIAKAVEAILHAIRFNDLAKRSGFDSFAQSMGSKADSSDLISLIAKWFIRLIVLVAAFDALGLPAVSDVLRQLLLWLPNLLVALLVLVIGGLAAKALTSLVYGAAAKSELGNPELLANITRIAVWTLAIFIAVNQIGVATTIVNTLFTAIVGATALAFGLAFGFGGKDTAAEIVRNWYHRNKNKPSN
jgi:hypothetical protein